jgi:hypothetical protein
MADPLFPSPDEFDPDLDVEAPSSTGNISEEHYEGRYTNYICQQFYVGKQGFYQMPKASVDGACRIVTAHQPYVKRIIEWTATRHFLPPTIPAPVPTSDNEVLDEWEVNPMAPTLLEDGVNQEYVVAGRYVFLLRNPVTYEDGFAMGGVPWSTVLADDNVLPAASFSEELLGTLLGGEDEDAPAAGGPLL